MRGNESLKCGDATTTASTTAFAATLSARNTVNAMDSSECAEATASHAVVVVLELVGPTIHTCTRADKSHKSKSHKSVGAAVSSPSSRNPLGARVEQDSAEWVDDR